MNPDITADQHAVWKTALALQLRIANGDRFQDFFNEVMTASHGDKYVPIRAHGSLGDKGCDGYTRDDGCVYQCYGALNAKLNVGTFTKKMTKDLATAQTKLSAIMLRWAMVHNLDGLPTDVLLHFEQLRHAHPKYPLAMMSRDAFERMVFSLTIQQIEGLIGTAIALKGSRDLDAKALSDLIAGIVEAADAPEPPDWDPKTVPSDKMDFNKIPGHWRRLLKAHADLSVEVTAYFRRQVDPTVGDQVASVLKTRYIELRQQELSAGDILDSLHESVVSSGTGLPAPEIQQAGFAILAHFFDSCEIFEDHPDKVPA